MQYTRAFVYCFEHLPLYYKNYFKNNLTLHFIVSNQPENQVINTIENNNNFISNYGHILNNDYNFIKPLLYDYGYEGKNRCIQLKKELITYFKFYGYNTNLTLNTNTSNYKQIYKTYVVITSKNSEYIDYHIANEILTMLLNYYRCIYIKVLKENTKDTYYINAFNDNLIYNKYDEDYKP